MVMQYPEETATNGEIEAEFAIIMDAIVTIRRAKTLVDLGNQKIPLAYVKIDRLSPNNLPQRIEHKIERLQIETMKPFIARLGKVEEVCFTDSKIDNAISDIGEYGVVSLPTDAIDLSPIIDRLTKQREKLQKEADKLTGMLSNERFVANAPEAVITENRNGLADAQDKIEKITAQLSSLEN